ncbi:hypothetical protein AB1Y20_009845 [Prymnesium parvum]|uniref:Thioredoxin domain-containing protein n=1 Tax=Prymnesium parvum TaxID=97485 RepID=A0AB34K548_PRYPA
MSACALLALAALSGVMGVDVIELSPSTLSRTVSRHKRMVVLLYSSPCLASSQFEPWLYAISQLMPRLAFGRIDVSGPAAPVAATFNVSSLPAIKVFLRDNPVGERIIDYEGPLEFDRLVDWCRAIVHGIPHADSRVAFEPQEHMPQSASKGSTSSNELNDLPASVRLMAETMVREQRLQRVLKQRGGGMIDRYESLVASRYQKIVEDEAIDVNDKFASQEGNRRARDQVRDEILATAPADVREEIERDVHLGGSGARRRLPGTAAPVDSDVWEYTDSQLKDTKKRIERKGTNAKEEL